MSKIWGQKGAQKVAKKGHFWVIFGPFLAHFDRRFTLIWAKKGGQKVPKMAQKGSFLEDPFLTPFGQNRKRGTFNRSGRWSKKGQKRVIFGPKRVIFGHPF